MDRRTPSVESIDEANEYVDDDDDDDDARGIDFDWVDVFPWLLSVVLLVTVALFVLVLLA